MKTIDADVYADPPRPAWRARPPRRRAVARSAVRRRRGASAN